MADDAVDKLQIGGYTYVYPYSHIGTIYSCNNETLFLWVKSKLK